MAIVNVYPRQQIDAVRRRMEGQLFAYQAMVAGAGLGNEGFRIAHQLFEPFFFNHLLVVLNNCFGDRSRKIEKKDGNALNEARMLADSIQRRAGIFTVEKTVKYKPEQSLLHLRPGDEIQLTLQAFMKIYTAFMAEIEVRFADPADSVAPAAQAPPKASPGSPFAQTLVQA